VSTLHVVEDQDEDGEESRDRKRDGQREQARCDHIFKPWLAKRIEKSTQKNIFKHSITTSKLLFLYFVKKNIAKIYDILKNLIALKKIEKNNRSASGRACIVGISAIRRQARLPLLPGFHCNNNHYYYM